MGKDVTYSRRGILLSHEKEWNNAFGDNMDGPRDDHTKWSQIYDITYMWNLKYINIYKHTHMYVYAQTHKLIHKTEIDTQTENKLYSYQRGKEGER